MLKNILNVDGVKELNKNEKESIKAGVAYYGSECTTHCAATCRGGYCYQWLY